MAPCQIVKTIERLKRDPDAVFRAEDAVYLKMPQAITYKAPGHVSLLTPTGRQEFLIRHVREAALRYPHAVGTTLLFAYAGYHYLYAVVEAAPMPPAEALPPIGSVSRLVARGPFG